MSSLPPLIIPVENQVRELDPKLLLATVAASKGIPSYIGYRTEIDIMISKLPRSIYLAKSFTHRSDKMFRILSKLGHTICAWDEEALVHYPPDIYFTRRLSPISLQYISHLFAWGQDNVDLFRSYPHLSNDIPIYKVGNPRLDMLRKEFEYYYEDETSSIKQMHGKFILFNTNFGNVNAHLPIHNLFINKDEQGNYMDMGRGSTGMGRDFATGRAKFKQALFESFTSLISYTSKSFSDTKIIIRPHPVENKNPYYQLAAKHKNIEVIQEGNVIPWIKASAALIHSGCTTGIEAFLFKQPAIAYTPFTDTRFGYDALIPDTLSHRCETNEAVEQLLRKYLDHTLPPINSSALNDYIEFKEDSLCCTNIVSVLEDIRTQSFQPNSATINAQGWILANKRKFIKRIKGLSSKSKYHQSFQDVRFPSLDINSLQEKVDKFAQIINTPNPITIKQVYPHIFLVQ